MVIHFVGVENCGYFKNIWGVGRSYGGAGRTRISLSISSGVFLFAPS